MISLLLVAWSTMTLGSQTPAANRVLARLPDGKSRDLARAAGRGDARGMQRAIARGADVNAIGEEGVTPLVYALSKKNIKGFRWLLERGGNPNVAVGADRLSIVTLACEVPNIEFLAAALEYGGDPNWRDDEPGRHYPLFRVLSAGGEAHAKLLVEKGASLNVIGGVASCTPMAEAIYLNNFELARWMLGKGADPKLSGARAGSLSAIGVVELVKERWSEALNADAKAALERLITDLEGRGFTVSVRPTE